MKLTAILRGEKFRRLFPLISACVIAAACLTAAVYFAAERGRLNDTLERISDKHAADYDMLQDEYLAALERQEEIYKAEVTVRAAEYAALLEQKSTLEKKIEDIYEDSRLEWERNPYKTLGMYDYDLINAPQMINADANPDLIAALTRFFHAMFAGDAEAYRKILVPIENPKINWDDVYLYGFLQKPHYYAEIKLLTGLPAEYTGRGVFIEVILVVQKEKNSEPKICGFRTAVAKDNNGWFVYDID